MLNQLVLFTHSTNATTHCRAEVFYAFDVGSRYARPTYVMGVDMSVC